MNDKERKSIKLLLGKSLNKLKQSDNFEQEKSNFLSDFSVDVIKNPGHLIALLCKSYDEKSSEDFSLLLAIVNIFDLQRDVPLEFFITALSDDWHYCHEDIVLILGNIKSDEAVDILYRTALANFKYLDYEYGHDSLRFKCLIALMNINTPKAIEKLTLLSKLGCQFTRERAKQMLETNRIGSML